MLKTILIKYQMILEFDSGQAIDIQLNDSPLKPDLVRIFQHLQHVPIPFRDWDKPIMEFYDRPQLIDLFEQKAKALHIDINRQRCFDYDQQHFNDLHEIFEKNSDHAPAWLDYHEMLHYCEFKKDRDWLSLDYRQLAGPLTRPFDREWLSSAVLQIKAGEVFCTSRELGKTPYGYWKDREPQNLARVCELAKPWLVFRPALLIALCDIDFQKNKDVDNFLLWWKPYQDAWCQHHGLQDWHWHECFSVIPVGRVSGFSRLVSLIRENAVPTRIKLDNSEAHHEMLHIELVFNLCWTCKVPSISISMDSQAIEIPELVQGTNKIIFDIAADFGKHKLTIYRGGADNLDPQQMVIIEHLSIGNINCDKLILSNSYFVPTYSEPWATQQRQQGHCLLDQIPFETVLGHNGSWHLEFESPFYPYLLRVNP